MDGKDDHHHRNRTKPRILYIKIELSVKYHKLGLLGPSFIETKTGGKGKKTS
jgi:hypothetical protein